MSCAATRPVAGEPAPPLGRTIDVRQVLNGSKVSRLQLRVFSLCFFIASLDGFDVQSMAFVAPSLAPLWGIPRELMGQILTAGLLGLLFGSVLSGPLSDRFGRRPVLLGSVALFGVGSLITALSIEPAHLMLTRCITGIGLGAAIVAGVSLTAEYAPDRLRATAVTGMFIGFPLGGAIGGLCATPLIEAFGWQAIFVIGGAVPLLFLPVAWRHLPESLQFRANSGEQGPAIGGLLSRIDPDYTYRHGDRFVVDRGAPASARVSELFVSHRLAGTLLLWLICFANLLVLYFLANWLPSILRQSGLSLMKANLGAAIFNLGGIIGGLALGRAVDLLGAFRVLAVAYGLTAVVIWSLSVAQRIELVFVLTFLAGAGTIGSQFCINALITAFYPTAVRSTGVGWALGCGRVGSIAGPLLGGFALGSGASITTIFAATALPVLVCCVAVSLLAGAYRNGSADRVHATPSR